jgi:hypothetical protein
VDLRDKLDQVLGCRSIPAHGLDRRPADVLVVVEPLLPQLGDRNRFVAQGGRRADLQLGIDLGGHLPSRIPVDANARLAPLAMLDVGQIPDLAAEVNAHAADAKGGSFFAHLGAPAEKVPATKRYKKRYKRAFSGRAQKRNCPRPKDLWNVGSSKSGEDRKLVRRFRNANANNDLWLQVKSTIGLVNSHELSGPVKDSHEWSA